MTKTPISFQILRYIQSLREITGQHDLCFESFTHLEGLSIETDNRGEWED